ncbi:hypothetical protein [Streptomyces sp. NPDC059893]|uniref:hypothetical protein n=1 Tax=Streptomyces sp. NPDC059893 TaxID=3346990 RepID=UPI0036660ED2
MFVELVYEQNSHKQVARTQDKTIRELKVRFPRDDEAAEQAAQHVRYHLSELIGSLAYEKINGNTAPAVDILVSRVERPRKVKVHLWTALLSDLLRPAGVLAQRADDFDFLHQTLLEYHAARHATRDEQGPRRAPARAGEVHPRRRRRPPQATGTRRLLPGLPTRRAPLP